MKWRFASVRAAERACARTPDGERLVTDSQHSNPSPRTATARSSTRSRPKVVTPRSFATVLAMRRGLRLLPLLLLAACKAPSSTPERPADHSPAAPRESAPAAIAASANPLADVRAHGELHTPVIRIPALGPVPERYVALLGSPDVARAAWVVTPGASGDSLRVVDEWPAGVRVVGSVVHASVVYLLLESVAVLDQPAGMRAVWFDGFGNTSPFTLAPPEALRGIHDMTELEQRIGAASAPSVQEAAPPRPPDPRAAPSDAHPSEPPPEAELLAALRGASKSEAALATSLSTSGVTLFAEWQSTFHEKKAHLSASSLLSASQARTFLGLTKDALKTDVCDGFACDADTPLGHASIGFARESDRWMIRSIERAAPTPEPPALLPPRAVPAHDGDESTRRVLREHVRRVVQVLGEAPLHAPSAAPRMPKASSFRPRLPMDPEEHEPTIGVAITDVESGVPACVIADGDYTRVFPLSPFAIVSASITNARYDARFADLDGDGRTDVVVRVTGTSADESPLVFTQAYLAPPASVQATEMILDHASDLAGMDAKTVDAAVQAAMEVPRRGVSSEDACRMIDATRWQSAASDFHAMATDDARVLSFDEPTLPTLRPRLVATADIGADDVRDPLLATARRCKDLECSKTRPFCAFDDGSAYYWFTWSKAPEDGGKLRIAAAAFWSGT